MRKLLDLGGILDAVETAQFGC